MQTSHNPKLRFGLSLEQARVCLASAAVANPPPLPAVNYGLVGSEPPKLLPTPAGTLPQASTVVMTWAEAEWAALQQVFCGGGSTMPYGERSRSLWPGWQKYSANLMKGAPANWDYWGYYRLVEVSGKSVLLFKSNTHLDWPGASFLGALIEMLATQVKPELILSIGTAGGARTQDHIGTVRAVSAATLYESGQPQASWAEYKNGWTGPNTVLANAGFNRLLFPVPTKASDLQALCSAFNQQYSSRYTLVQLDPVGLNLANVTPQIDNQTGSSASLLTTSTFVVGTTAGDYQAFTSIEMDDAIVGEACASRHTAFGFIRNVSDPVQNAVLPATVQGRWGSAVYDAYGFYTSYNGALTAWAMLA